MADVFFNLATQSLGSSIAVQPLILPLFAPAPSLVPDAALSPADIQLPLVAETPPFSMPSESIADEMTDTWEMESPFQETTSKAERPVLPDLIPSGVPEYPISTVSIRAMLRPQISLRENLEPAMPAGQAQGAVPTADASILEERDAFSSQTASPVEADADTSEIFPSSTRSEQSGNVAGVPTQQPSSSQSKPQASTVTTSDQPMVFPPPGGDSAIKPLPNQPVRQGRKSERSEDGANRLFTSAAKPVVQPVINPEIARPAMMPVITPDAPDLAQTPVTPLTVSAQNVMPVITRHINQEMQITATERSSRLDGPTTSMEPAERVSNPLASPSSTASEILHAPPVVEKQRAYADEEEVETSPVRVTIGRVVVRATPTAAPAPTQKRMLRPALSLGEYLKQRERGSR